MICVTKITALVLRIYFHIRMRVLLKVYALIKYIFLLSILTFPCNPTLTKYTMQNETTYSLHSCPKLADFKYPKLDEEADVIYKKALVLSKEYNFKKQLHQIAKLYEEATQKGHWKAMGNLARMYVSGLGIEKNWDTARKLYLASAQAKTPESYINLSYMYSRGIGTKVDKDKAYEYIKKAAKLGHPVAQRHYGFNILGYSELGKDWLRCAIIQGDGESAYNLALFYDLDQSDLVDEDREYSKVLSLYLESGRLGFDLAFNTLYNVFYIPQLNLNKDKKRANCFYTLEKKVRLDSSLRFPNLDKRCPSNVSQPYQPYPIQKILEGM